MSSSKCWIVWIRCTNNREMQEGSLCVWWRNREIVRFRHRSASAWWWFVVPFTMLFIRIRFCLCVCWSSTRALPEKTPNKSKTNSSWSAEVFWQVRFSHNGANHTKSSEKGQNASTAKGTEAKLDSVRFARAKCIVQIQLSRVRQIRSVSSSFQHESRMQSAYTFLKIFGEKFFSSPGKQGRLLFPTRIVKNERKSRACICVSVSECARECMLCVAFICLFDLRSKRRRAQRVCVARSLADSSAAV